MKMTQLTNDFIIKVEQIKIFGSQDSLEGNSQKIDF